MSTLKRFIITAPIALGVTFGLGLAMAGLVHVEFTGLADKPERLNFEVNAKITPDPSIASRVVTPVQRVETPPALPVVSTTPTTQVVVPRVPDPSIPIWKDLTKEIKPTKMNVNLGLVPLFRAKPPMPTRAERSGHCDVMFDVNADGNTYNVSVLRCSQSVFSRASIKAASKWKYRAQVIDGKSVPRTGIKTTISFHLTDEHGRIIPE